MRRVKFAEIFINEKFDDKAANKSQKILKFTNNEIFIFLCYLLFRKLHTRIYFGFIYAANEQCTHDRAKRN